MSSAWPLLWMRCRMDREEVFASDPSILLRVLVNLVKNALEASGAGQAAVLSASGDSDGVTFTVRNAAALPRHDPN